MPARTVSSHISSCNFREKRKALVTGPPSHFLFLMCLIIFTTSTIQIMAIIKSPKINISVPPQISIIGTIIIASKSIMPIMNNNVITLSPSFHYRSCRFRENEKGRKDPYQTLSSGSNALGFIALSILSRMLLSSIYLSDPILQSTNSAIKRFLSVFLPSVSVILSLLLISLNIIKSS